MLEPCAWPEVHCHAHLSWARRAAKSAKNYAEADGIRDDLAAKGIELIDKPGGVTEWIRR